MTEHEAPEGYEYKWMPEKPGTMYCWEVGGDGKVCRYCGGVPLAACRKPAVAKLRRSNGWWYYCADHLYGRKIENGQVLFLKLVPKAEASA